MSKKDFPKKEFECRWNKAKELMEEQGLDALFLTERTNYRYFTGHASSQFKNTMRPATVLVPAEGDPVMMVYNGDVKYAEPRVWIDDIRAYVDVPFPPELVSDTITDLGLEDGRIGCELGENERLWVSIQTFEAIKSALPNAEFVDGSSVIQQCRLIKSSHEIERIEKAVEITENAWDLMLERIEPGMTMAECEDMGWQALADAGTQMGNPGSAPGFLILKGPMRPGTESYSKKMSYNITHSDEVTYEEGDLFYADFGGQYEGYQADIARRATLGPPSDRQLKHHEQIVNIENRIIDKMAPGVSMKDIHDLFNQDMEALGMSPLPASKRIGHGMGLQTQEPPSLNAVDPTILEPGMVLTPEPRYKYDGILVMVEEDVVITENGARPLAKKGYEELRVIDV